MKTNIKKCAEVCMVMIIFAILLSRQAFAWGPERPTYTNSSPAEFATFNSITDNVAVGDERNFVRVREAGIDSTFEDEMEVVPGKEYEVYIYYHNDAASNTNSTGFGVATDVRIASSYPTSLNPDERGAVTGIIHWSYRTPDDSENALDGEVWDEAYLTTQYPNTVLRYKTGTAVIHNGGETNDSVLSTDLFSEDGTYIGFNKLTGIIPGCAEYSGYITYTLVAESTTSEFTHEVSTDGKTWSNSVTVAPGDYVTYRVTFENTGNTTLTNVVFTDSHSDDLTLHSGSTTVFDVNNTSSEQIDDIIDLSGYNVGDVAPGGLVQIIYQEKVNVDMTDFSEPLSDKISVEYNGEIQSESITCIYVSGTEVVSENTQTIDSPPADNSNSNFATIAISLIIILGFAVGFFIFWRTRSKDSQ